MFQEILLAVDGSDHALKAAGVAGELARCMQANVRVVTVYEPIPPYLQEPGLQDAMDERFGRAEKVLTEALEALGPVPCKLLSEQLEGPVAEAVLNVIATHPVDLIVMGARGLGRLQGLLLGSQSQKVLAHAPCPVMLVR
jgi:nucleotide-binding universal stress UspA family protein